MISAASGASGYQTRFSNGAAEFLADVKPELGGAAEAMRPHELLEAAIAT